MREDEREKMTYISKPCQDKYYMNIPIHTNKNSTEILHNA